MKVRLSFLGEGRKKERKSNACLDHDIVWKIFVQVTIQIILLIIIVEYKLLMYTDLNLPNSYLFCIYFSAH